MTYILFCGSRSWTNYLAIYRAVDQLRRLLGKFTVLQGGARGADTYARIAGKLQGLDHRTELPDYPRYNQYKAPKVRNTEMLKLRPKYVVAFWDRHSESGGTLDTVDKAVNYFRIPTIVYTGGEQ